MGEQKETIIQNRIIVDREKKILLPRDILDYLDIEIDDEIYFTKKENEIFICKN